MAFKAATARFIELPINGKKYRINSPSAEVGLWAQRIMTIAEEDELSEEDAAALHLDDQEEAQLYPRLLGPAYDQMIADGVDWETLQIAGQTVVTWCMSNEGLAEAFWNNEMATVPKGVKVPTDRQPAKKSTSKAAAKRTTSASRGGSTTARARSKASGSRGARSSSTGS